MGKPPPPRSKPSFVAIDFETADYDSDSACAIGLVRVEKGKIIQRKHYHLRPPRREFIFTYLHGIGWKDVQKKPSFASLWPRLKEELAGVQFLAAHNADFDRNVLSACCQAAEVRPPSIPFLCTVRLARRIWGVYPTKLPNVCQYLGIDLNHHEALSDAEACARIVLAACKEDNPDNWMPCYTPIPAISRLRTRAKSPG